MFENKAICGVIHLGKRGENLARRIVFDECSIWESEFGKGEYYLFHQRNGDAAPYPVALKVEDGVIYWEVSSSDTDIEGEGKCELRYVVGDVIVKSHTWKTIVSEGLDNSSAEVPDPSKPWVDQVIEAATEVHNSFAGALRGEALGKTAIALKDVSEVQHDVKVEISSNNIPLIPYEINDNGDEYMGGLQYTIHKDGRIELQGVCNNGYDVPMSLETTIKRIVLPSGTYTFDYEESGNDVNNGVYGVYLKDVNEKWFGGTFTIDAETEFDLTIGTITQTGERYNITIKPMLSKGEELSPPITEDTKIKVFGDNLLNISNFTIQNFGICKWSDDVLHIALKNNHYGELWCHDEAVFDMLEALDGQMLTLSVDAVIPSNLRMAFGLLYEDGVADEFWGALGSNVISEVFDLKFKRKGNRKTKYVFLRPLFSDHGRDSSETVAYKNFKLEIGKKSPYHPYKPPEEYNIGDSIPHSYPSMTLICKGAEIEVKYNRDLNFVVDSIINRLAAIEEAMI